MRKCRLAECRQEIPPLKVSNMFQRAGFCDDRHMARHGLVKAKAIQERQRKAEHRQAKERIKTRSERVREAQQAWNRYVRARDLGKPCASCGATPSQKMGGTMDCSHYRSVGSAPHLRFHLHNAAAACVRCNRELSGNIVALRAGLIERIGLEKVEAVECDQRVRKFDINYLIRLKKIFQKRALLTEKRYQSRAGL